MAKFSKLRVKSGMSQRTVAAKAGVSTPMVIRMEAGKPVLESKFRACCQVIGADPDQVTGVKIYNPVQDRNK